MKRSFWIVSLLTVIMLLLNMCSPVMAAGFSQMYERQTIQIVPDNVEFDVKVGDSKNVVLDVNNKGELTLNIKVNKTGYLKNASIILNNTNFELEKVNADIVKAVKGNVIELNQIPCDRDIKLVIPFKYKKDDKVNINSLISETDVTLDAVYVYGSNIQKRFNKTIKLNVNWVTNKDTILNAILSRYIRYDTNNTMVSFDIEDGIANNDYPISSKSIEIKIPNINGKEPTKVIATGEDISYKYENGILKINKNNNKDSKGLIKWNSISKTNVTLLYDTYTDQSQNVVLDMKSKITLLNGKDVEKTINTQVTLDKQIGNIVNADLQTNDTLSKGQLYSNIDTDYDVTYRLNVGYAQLVDKMLITDGGRTNANIKNKKVSVSEQNFKNILGNDGIINVYAVDSKKLLGTISKDRLDIEVNYGNLFFETSKPVQEGDLLIKVSKVLVANENVNLFKLDNFDEIANVQSDKGDLRKSSVDLIKNIKLIEPVSKAAVSVNTNELLTTNINKMVFDISLKTNELTDRLYSNPTIVVDLPEEISDVKLDDVQILYSNDFKVRDYSLNGKKLIINLDGIQKSYNLGSVIEGPLIRIVSRLKLNDLTPSAERDLSVTVNNNASGEKISVSTKLKEIAPSQFITLNEVSDGKNLVSSQNNQENVITFDARANSKVMIAHGAIVNNSSKDANNTKVLGRIVTPNSKIPDGQNTDLGSQFDTVMSSDVKVSGIDNYKVYYSPNVNATADLNDQNNGWTNVVDNNSKSYLIVFNNVLKNGQRVDFSYNFVVPENIDYSMIGKTMYSVYYDNELISGNSTKVINSTPVDVKSSDIPVLNSNVRIFDYNTNQEYANGQDIPSGKLLRYVVSVQNIGKDVAKNIELDMNTTDNSMVYDYVNKYKNKYSEVDKHQNKVIPEIKPGEVIDTDYLVYKNGVKLDDKYLKDTEKVAAVLVKVSAKQYGYEQDYQLNNNLVEGGLETVLMNVDDDVNELKMGGSYKFEIFAKNEGFKEQHNVIVTMKVPRGMKFVTTNNQNVKYDDKTRQIKFEVGTLNAKFDIYKNDGTGEIDHNKGSLKRAVITLSLDRNVDATKDIELKTETYVDIRHKVQDSAPLKYPLRDILKAKVQVRNNIGDNANLLDTDDVIYYGSVKNDSDAVQSIRILNRIPDGINVKSYVVKVGDREESYSSTNGIITSVEDVNPGEVMQLIINAKPSLLGSVDSIMPIDDVIEVSINDNPIGKYEIKNVVKGTANRYSENYKKKNEQYKLSKNDTDYKYAISGNVWNDNNMNGIKDIDEINVKGLKVYLYQENGKDLVKDEKGKDVTTITDDQGNYSFEKLKLGNYIVVVDYDSNKYNLTNYKSSKGDDMSNSKFVNKELNNHKVAITDVLRLNKSSIYNVNLGLVSNVKFSLSLLESVDNVKINGNKAFVTGKNGSFVNVDFNNNKLDNTTALVEYNIKVKNNGLIEGYAKSIVDYIPEGFEFSPELNKVWYVGNNNYLYNNSLQSTLLKPGEVKELKLILSYKLSNDKLKLTHNVAEIAESISIDGLSDNNSKVLNQNEDEDDFAYSDVYFTKFSIAMNVLKIVLIIVDIAIVAVLMDVLNKKFIIKKGE